MYNWQQKNWPHFHFESEGLEADLLAYADVAGQVSGTVKALPAEHRIETILSMMVAEAIKTSEIEGQYLSRPDVLSSVRNNLGLNKKNVHVKDKNAQGVATLMFAVRDSYAEKLTEAALMTWHRTLMANARHISVGVWRSHTEPMQVVSGRPGKENIHFEAPPSTQVATEMKRFFKWFNDTAPGGKNPILQAPVRAAIAHLYFESIHPFEDGNGRIGRAIAEKAISQTMGRPVILSLSQAIEADRKVYYSMLEKAQKSTDVTSWVSYFVGTTLKAQQQALGMIEFTLQKSNFFVAYGGQLNERQLKVVNKMFHTPAGSYKGGMTARKYISLTKTSKATATRDMQQLAEMGAFVPEGGGRSTSYQLVVL